jgi:hypothetical protein
MQVFSVVVEVNRQFKNISALATFSSFFCVTCVHMSHIPPDNGGFFARLDPPTSGFLLQKHRVFKQCLTNSPIIVKVYDFGLCPTLLR